jgi:hypothetical protein
MSQPIVSEELVNAPTTNISPRYIVVRVCLNDWTKPWEPNNNNTQCDSRSDKECNDWAWI